MRYSSLIIVTGLANWALAAGPAMSDRFTVSSTCDTAKLDAVLTDAITLTNNAVAALQALIGFKGWLFSSTGTGSFASAAEAAFGVGVPDTLSFGYSVKDKTQLQNALDNYKILQNALVSGIKLNPARHWLFCDSSKLQWTTIAQDIFTDVQSPTETIEQFFANSKPKPVKGVKGLWKDPEHKIGTQYIFVRDEYNGGPICGPKAAEGITFQAAGTMFLCPKAWVPTNYKQTLSALPRTGRTTWDDVRNLPGVFIHEMMHMLPIKPHITDEYYRGDRAYGQLRTLNLGLDTDGFPNANPTCLTNADSYHVFATIAYLTSAKVVPEEDKAKPAS